MKVRNVGSTAYIGPAMQAQPGEEIEVTAEQAAYLTGAECPGDFQIVEEAYIEKGKKGRKVAE